MPEELGIDDERRLVISRAWGVFTDEEFTAHWIRVRNYPDFPSTYAHLIDLRGVSTLGISSSVLADVASSTAFALGARRAVVAPTSAHFGVARMFATFSERTGQVLAVFRTLEEAHEYLGVA